MPRTSLSSSGGELKGAHAAGAIWVHGHAARSEPLLRAPAEPAPSPALTSLHLPQNTIYSVEAELTAILRGESQTGAAASGDTDGEDADGDECGSPDLDESLDSHFNYIQKVSAPQVGAWHAFV